MSDFVSLNTALTGLRAARVRIDTAANNVANAGTRGYTRQRVDLHPSTTYDSSYGPLGTGVDVTRIARARDAFLDTRVRTDGAELGALTVRAELLDRAELALAEPDQGLSGPLADLWSAFEDLAHAPTSTGARIAALSAMDALAARVRTISSGWDQLAADTASAIAGRVAEANDLLQQVADLNRAIQAQPGANDLMDRRDVVLDELAQKLGVTATVQGDGTVRVSLSGMSLVDGTTVSALSIAPDGSLGHPSGIVVAAGGEIGGYRRFQTEDLPALRASLDAFAESLASALNTQHAAGWVSETQPGGALLTFTPGRAAATIAAAITDPAQLAVSSVAGPPFPAFNGSNAQALADLRTSIVGSDTLDGAARAIATELGGRVAGAKRAALGQGELAGAAELARSGQHGVSLDEEMTMLMEAQHAYHAAARVMSAVDEALEHLINRTGMVGR